MYFGLEYTMNRYEEALDDWASQFADAAAFDNELDTASDNLDGQALRHRAQGWRTSIRI